MYKTAQHFTVMLFAIPFVLMGCVSKQPLAELPAQTAEQRIQALEKINQWRIKGKIAFIQKIPNKQDKRERATISWLVNNHINSQALNLTSYLGINVLTLTSDNGQHRIKFDGKEHQSDNLAQLLYSLTGLTLPTDALSYWLTGLPYQENDTIIYDENNGQPLLLTSFYHNASWQINYDNYQVFDGLPMATTFTIKTESLTLKIAVKQWTLNF